MADAAKPREGLPFVLFLLALILGSVWNGAGGNFSAFGHVVTSLTQSAGPQDNFSDRLERLIHIPKRVKFAPPRIVPPPAIASAEAQLAKLPGPLPPLAQLGGENKANPFFVKWAQDLLEEAKAIEANKDPNEVPVAVDPKKKGVKYEEDTYVFTGIVKIKDEPPVAVIRDVAKKSSQFLKQGERYREIEAVKVDLTGATFKVGSNTYPFDTLHATTKTFTVRRIVK